MNITDNGDGTFDIEAGTLPDDIEAADLETVKELVAAGEKAFPNTFDDTPHNSYSETLGALVLWGSDGDALVSCHGDWSGSEVDDLRFIIASKQALPALSKLVKHVEVMRKLIISFEKATDKHCDSYSQEMMELALEINALEKDK